MHRVADSLDRRGRSAVLGAPARLRPGANGLGVVDGNGAARILPPPFKPPALEVAASR
jgi:hypothetical protein